MQAEMKCPTCGGDKYKFLGGNTFKCAYCGATFVNEQQAPEPPVEAPKQTEVITRVEYIPQQQTSSQGTGNSVVKGMAQGAGAGGDSRRLLRLPCYRPGFLERSVHE